MVFLFYILNSLRLEMMAFRPANYLEVKSSITHDLAVCHGVCEMLNNLCVNITKAVGSSQVVLHVL